MWFRMVTTFIRFLGEQQILTTVMTRIVVDKSTGNASYSICFLRNVKESVFSVLKLKKALRDTLTRATLSGLLSTTAN